MLMLCGCFALSYLFASNIFGQMKWFKWIDGKREQLKRTKNPLKITFLFTILPNPVQSEDLSWHPRNRVIFPK